MCQPHIFQSSHLHRLISLSPGRLSSANKYKTCLYGQDSANNGDGAPNPQPPPASRIASLGNPLFRSMERGGSFWQGRLNSSSSATPATGRRGRSFSRNRDRPNGATDAGTRAVERAVNGDSSSRTSRGVTNAAAAGRGGGNATNSADASESGRGVGGGGDGDASEEGQILFYHKPTLANVPAGDVPDVVPVYLGCPRGGMALGLPLNDAWQGGEQQVRRVLTNGKVFHSCMFCCGAAALLVEKDISCD